VTFEEHDFTRQGGSAQPRPIIACRGCDGASRPGPPQLPQALAQMAADWLEGAAPRTQSKSRSRHELSIEVLGLSVDLLPLGHQLAASCCPALTALHLLSCETIEALE
jgi:hypothetical protein